MAKEVYQFNNVWIDWGCLSYILGIRSEDSAKWSVNQAKERIEKIIDFLKSEGIEDPRLFIGFQSLESNSKERRAFIQEIIDNEKVLYISLPDKSGYEAIHWLYTLMEIQARFIAYHEGLPYSTNIWKQFFQSILYETNWSSEAPSMPNLNLSSYKFLGKQFKEIVQYHREDYKSRKISLDEIYQLEKSAMYDFFKQITTTNLPKITDFIFSKIPPQMVDKIFEEFFKSEYFRDIQTLEVFLNLFSVLLSSKSGYELSESERQDLIGAVEATIFGDICYVDNRIYQLWERRPNKSITIEFRKFGNLVKLMGT